MKIDTDLLIKLDDALRLLPGVVLESGKRFLTRELSSLKDAEAWNLMRSNRISKRASDAEQPGEAGIILKGVRVSFSDAANLFPYHRSMRVTPAGAALLIELYRAGALPMKQKATPVEEPPLTAYAASGPDLERQQAERDAPNRRYEHLLANPAEIAESEFEYGVLDAVFWRHCGSGSHTMQIGGIEVSKTVGGLSASNSGKSRSFDVAFRWTGSDGRQHAIEKESRYKDNRRNDPARNWGLGRE